MELNYVMSYDAKIRNKKVEKKLPFRLEAIYLENVTTLKKIFLEKFFSDRVGAFRPSS